MAPFIVSTLIFSGTCAACMVLEDDWRFKRVMCVVMTAAWWIVLSQ